MNNDHFKDVLETIKEVHYGVRVPADISGYKRQIFVEFPNILEYLDQNYIGTKENLEEEQTGHPPTPWEILGMHFYHLGSEEAVFLDLSRIIYEHWYNHQINFELTQSERTIHKGTPLHQLGLIWQIKREDEKARRYLLLALIEDIIKSLGADLDAKQQGFRVLSASYYLDDKTFELIHEVVVNSEDKRFPEKILFNVLHGNKRVPTWEEASGITADLKFLKNEFYRLLQLSFSSTKEKGDAYENFIAIFLSIIDGVLVKYLRQEARTSSGRKKFEYDLIIQNSALSLKEFGRYIPVECKLYKNTVKFPEVVKFIYKVRNSGCRVGFIFAQNGITSGVRNEIIRDSYFLDNVTVLVLTKDDIVATLSGVINLLQLLNTKYEQIRFNL